MDSSGPMSDEISRKDPRLLKNLATLNWETGEIIPATDLIDWAVAFERHNKHVGYDEVSGFIVSTVFMGINHTRGSRRPQWFETMVFRQMDNKRMLGRLDRSVAIRDARGSASWSQSSGRSSSERRNRRMSIFSQF
jgi:hypothetical protein